jgi:hypothetical protein
MPQSTCACSTSGTTAAKEIIPGLSEADLSTITLSQGVPWTWKQCFAKSLTPTQVIEEQVGGKVVLNRSQHCFKVGDLLRLINYDPCKPDTDDTATVFPVTAIVPNPADPTQDILTATGLVTINKVYQALATSSQLVPIGCAIGSTATSDLLPPYVMVVCDGAPLLITGGITARDDYRESFAVETIAGSAHIYSTVLGKIQPGDAITAPAVGFIAPTKVLRVDLETVQNSLTGAKVQREKITMETKATVTNACAAITVKRGLIAQLEVVQDGRCWELTIPGGATTGLQLAKSMKNGAGYHLGVLTVTATYGKLLNGKLRTRTVVLLRSNVELNPSHMGVI